jgi:hypothetical protein
MKLTLSCLALIVLLAGCAQPPMTEFIPQATVVIASPTTAGPTQEPTPLITPASLSAEEWQDWPVVPYQFSARAAEIYRHGRDLGNNPQAYSKVGDCETTSAWFLGAFDEDPSLYSLGDYAYLQEIIDYFQGSHGRTSLAAGTGFTAANTLTPLWADHKVCLTDETPVACEIRIHRPAYALVMLGTNDVNHLATFDENMRKMLDVLIGNGVVPILATKADNLEGNHSINLEIARLAQEYDLPLWNFWRAVQPLPNHGLQADNSHLTWAGPFFNDPVRMRSAWPWRNLTALQTLDNAWRALGNLP